MTGPKTLKLSLSGRRGSSVKCRSIDEHAMHDHRELARERDLGFGHACALGDPGPPIIRASLVFESSQSRASEATTISATARALPIGS